MNIEIIKFYSSLFPRSVSNSLSKKMNKQIAEQLQKNGRAQFNMEFDSGRGRKSRLICGSIKEIKLLN